MGDTGDHRVLAKTRASQRRTLLVLWTAVLLYLTKMRVLKYLGYDDDSVSSSASLRDRDRDDRDEDKDSSTVVISHERCSVNEREDDSDDAAGIFWTKKRKKKRKKERSIKGNNEEEEENRGRRCTCERGYGGYRCNEAKCENSCEHGVCQYGYCLCEDGWKGVKCDQPLCQFEDGCGINGECANPDYCKCNEKWFGVKCDKRCERGRFRFLEQRCDCESEKWVGDACEWATCEGDCTKHGECVMPDLCECKFGFSGEKCDVDDLSAALMMSKNRTTTTTTTTTTRRQTSSLDRRIFWKPSIPASTRTSTLALFAKRTCASREPRGKDSTRPRTWPQSSHTLRRSARRRRHLHVPLLRTRRLRW